MLGKGCGTRLEDCGAAVLAVFESATPAEGFLALWLSELLADIGVNRERCGNIAEQLALMSRAFERQGQLVRARGYSAAAAAWFARAGEQAKSFGMTAYQAETWAKEALAKSTGSLPSNAVAASFYEQAIQLYRAVPRKHRAALNIEDRLSELHRLMSKAGEDSLLEMGRVHSDGVDISDLIRRSVDSVAGKKLDDALRAFVVLKAPSVAQRRSAAVQMLRDTPLRRLFGSTHVHSDGRVVAKVAAINLDDPESPEHQSAVWAEMLSHYRVEVHVAVQAVILPALEVLALEHRMTENDFVELAYRSPIVPHGRELLFARGILFGFDRDFASALHLLVPQIEHMVRWHLKAAGIRTTTLDRDGIETENGLSSLMDVPEVSKVFGEDLAFELKALFCDSLGGNLRNELAHGLLDYGACMSIWSIYAWWLVLGMLIKAFWNAQRRNPATEPQENI